ncbi:formin homology 2 domain containing protein [Babesia bovis T2Bo]|uniref:Formin homology 2 domain containing protein n=1 Tax=Babesia bovis TaxID=5865 RepID=A7ATY6_BABBO|nr:formin homology 2 domain containing protein [Babesia bovis T2Bo]EDO06397.1 formin homology 2 domain containing protein [Babesia bovis T2Bo]|eukprot:XP_001609965.1 formin homology 2 domain containing protein [Babesia bovis T2Bo]
MEYVDYDSLTEADIGAMEVLNVRSKVSELPMSSSSNISPYALGMSVRLDLEKRRRSTQTDKERDMMLGSSFMDSQSKLGASDKVLEAATILRKLESNCGAVVYREALATRMQLRNMALKNFSAQNYGEALLQAHYSLMLAKKFHMEVSKTPLSGEMAMELLILSKCYAEVGRLDAGRPYLQEFRFLVEQTLIHLVDPSGSNKRGASPLPPGNTLINCDSKVFPGIVFTLGEILTMYDMSEDSEMFFSKYLILCEREFGESSLQLSDAINSVCIYLLRSKQYLKALPLAVKALEIHKKHFGDYTSEDPDTRVAESYCNVGVIYRMAGNPIDALHNLLIALDMKMRILQDRSHTQVQDIFLSIGCCQHMIGNFHAAASIYREVYITRCDSLGATHPLSISVKHLIEDLDRDIKLAPKSEDSDKDDTTCDGDNDDVFSRVKALDNDMVHSQADSSRTTPGIEVSRVQSLYSNKTKHFLIPSTSIMQVQECMVVKKKVLDLSKQISSQYGCRRLPIINVPRMARGRVFINDGQPVMECNRDAIDLLLEWDFAPPEVNSEGDVTGSDPKLPKEVMLFIPLMDGSEPITGFYNKPLYVPNPGIFHAFKRSNVVRDFNVTVIPAKPDTSPAAPEPIIKRMTMTDPMVKISKSNQLLLKKGGAVIPKSLDGALAPKVTTTLPAKKLGLAPPKSTGDQPAALTPQSSDGQLGIKPKSSISALSGDATTAPKAKSASEVGAKKASSPPEKPPEPEVPPVALGEMFLKKASGLNNRNAKFLAKIGNLAKIVVKPNQISVPLPKVKVPAPVTHASPICSDSDSDYLSDAMTTSSDIDDCELSPVVYEVCEAPITMATLVSMPLDSSKLPLVLRSIHDPMPMDILAKVRGIRSHKDSDNANKCMLLDQNGASLAIVPWQIDLISLTLAKSCLSLDLAEKFAPKSGDISESDKENALSKYRKLLAGEGLNGLGFMDIIAGKASQSLSSAAGALDAGLGMDLPPSVLANLRKQAEELERKAKEEAEAKRMGSSGDGGDGDGPGGSGMPKVVPILKKGAPEVKKGAPPMKKGAPKGPPPAIKKGLPAKSKGKGSGPTVDNSRVRRFFWDPIFGDDVKGTLFASPKGLPNLDNPDIEETFAKAVPKARVAISAKPKVLSLLPDSKRAYNMNIGLSKFAKYTFKEVKDAVLNLNPEVLNAEATESLLTLLPTQEEITIVQEYVKSGGDVNAVDRPEQFVAVISTIPLLKQRLECHQIALTFKEHFDEIEAPLSRIIKGCEDVMTNRSLNVLANVVLKIGNALNAGDSKKGNAEGFKPTTFAKLNEFRTTTKPVKTLMQYICDIVARNDESLLQIYDDLRSCEDCSKIDMAVLEGGLAKLKNDMQRVSNAVASAERLKDPGDEFVPIMRDFMNDAQPKVSSIQNHYTEVMLLFRETVNYMGYPAKEVDKVKVDELFRHIWGFVKSVEVARQARLEAIAKEERLRQAELRKQEKAVARKSKMRTSLVTPNITATPKMLDDLANTVKMQS